MHDQDVRTRRRKENRIWRYALGTSILVHLLVLFLGGGRPIPLSPYAAAGPKAGDNRAAAGGVQAMNVVTPPSRPIERPVRPRPVDIATDPIEVSFEEAFSEPAFVGERPGAANAGTETGEGAGDGGTADEGLNVLVPPLPRGFILPPDAPRSLRGKSTDVWVFVTEHGEVVADSTRLDPPTRDRRYNSRLIREAAEWRFRPGTKGGLPIAAWAKYKITVGH